MKRLIILCAVLLLSCSSHNKDWSSGGEAQESFQHQRYQEQVETFRKQVPEARPSF